MPLCVIEYLARDIPWDLSSVAAAASLRRRRSAEIPRRADERTMSPRMMLRYPLLMATALLLAVTSASGVSAESTNVALRNLEARDYKALETHFGGRQREYAKGTLAELDLLAAFRAFYLTDPALGPRFDEWVASYPRSYAARLARGIYYKRIGTKHRGDRYTSETRPEQFEKMGEYFEKAMLDLDASLELEEKPILSYFHMMDIKKHSQPLSIHVWLFRLNLLDPKEYVFRQAMELAPDSFILRRKYMLSLRTRWSGSPAAMKAFLQECQQTKLSREHMNALAALVLADSGWLRVQRKNFPGALEDYKRAVALTDFSKDELFEHGIRALMLHEIAYAYQGVREYGEAVQFLNRAIDAGADGWDVYFSRGLSFAHLGKKKEALDDYLKAAERGHAWSQNEVGIHYWHGIIVQRNKEEAIKWFSNSANQGFAEAKKNLEWARKL